MATFKICIFKHQERRDHKWPVYIRVCWHRKYGYIKTEYYVTSKQIRKTKYIFELKDNHIIKELNGRITKYENIKKTQLGYNIELYTAIELAEYFKREGAPGTDTSIDFIEFAELHCKRLEDTGKRSTAAPLKSVINALVDFCGGRRKIYVTEITSKFLDEFEIYLKKNRTIKRKNQYGKIVVSEHPGLSTGSIFDYMVAIRTLFNAAKKEYNDEDKGEIRIRHYPFRKYELKAAPEPNKRVLSPAQIRTIRDCQPVLKRSLLARDVFMLSFYLAGTNLTDLYNMKGTDLKNGRISYCRRKTKNRRKDMAFISIKVFPVVLPLIEKYKANDGPKLLKFAQYYTTSEIFTSNIDKGLKNVAGICKIEERLNSYYARFSFASIARNQCKVSKDDIDLSLNHVDQKLKMADKYIEKDWRLIDNVIKKVINYINK